MSKHYQPPTARPAVHAALPAEPPKESALPAVGVVMLQVPILLPRDKGQGGMDNYSKFLVNKRLPNGSVLVDHGGILYEIPLSNIAALVIE